LIARRPTRRRVLTAAAAVAAAGSFRGIARANSAALNGATPGYGHIDAALRTATTGANELPGVVALAANDHEIIYEGAFGTRRVGSGQAMTRDTVFRVASMIKTITSVAAMQLVEQGKLTLDGLLPDIDPALNAPQVLEGFGESGKPHVRPARRPIALRHLLTHTSGFCYRLWDAEAVRYASARKGSLPHTPLMFDPGERWEYGTSIDWVGRLVEATSDQPLDVYFREHILDPLGMSDTGFVISALQRAREASVHRRKSDGTFTPEPMETPPSGPRHFSGGGGIYSSAPDYLALIRMLLNGGSFNGARILKPETVALMGQNQIGDIEAGHLKTTAPAFSNDVDFFPGIHLRWGFGHMINMSPGPNGRSAGSLTWGGLFNTYYWIDPTKRVAGVFMSQVLPFADRRALDVYHQFERGIYHAAHAA
jgi:CubicO group peptidase (beta-lactamase class C family)